MGMLLRDKLLTSDEYQAMVDGLAYSDAPATGRVVMTDWIAEHGPELGRRYANELELHYRSPEAAGEVNTMTTSLSISASVNVAQPPGANTRSLMAIRHA